MKLFSNLALYAGVAAFFVAGIAHAGSDGLVVDERSYDFGSVAQGARVSHEFLLQNKGELDIQLQKITPSCGCTAASVESNTIKPGEAGKVRVEFDTAGFNGAKTKTVEVLTSDPAMPEVVLTLRGTVVPGVVAEPKKVEFGELSPGNAENRWDREFAVTVKEGSSFKIDKVASYSRFITVLNGRVDGNVSNFKVEISKDAPRGELRDRLVVHFTDEKAPPLNVPVTASIRGDLRLVPSTVSFGVVEGSEILERRVKWENVSKSKVVVDRVDSPHPAIKAEFIPIQAGLRGVVVIKLDPRELHGDIRTTVDVHTDHPTESTLSLNVFAVEPPR